MAKASGLGLPKYYVWPSRSGCTFCFLQQKVEWVRLKRTHPEAFEEAIRPFVIGRKSWLFNNTQASAALYPLIETAKANGCELGKQGASMYIQRFHLEPEGGGCEAPAFKGEGGGHG